MDTGTHLVMGLGLAGLSTIDPVVASDPSLAAAVFAGTVLGSQAPDLDTVLRIRGNAAYIRNHRGLSHSIPAVAIWIAAITGLLYLFIPNHSLLHLGLWVALAVCIHIFSDLFNTYGTQAFRPISERWVAWNIIHIFDPTIFLSHTIALFLWSVHAAPPQFIFPVLYGLLILYYLWRTVIHHKLESRLHLHDEHYENGQRYLLIPTVNLFVWNIVKITGANQYMLGEWRKGNIRWIDHIQCSEHPAVAVSRNHPDIASFLYYSSYACAEVVQHAWGFEVRWADVRYRHRKQYPFVAVLLVDHEMTPLDSYVGWLSDSRVRKRLRLQEN